MPGLARVEAAMHGGAAAAFSPASLSDLLWWHDGTLSPKTTSGSNYTQWDDMSGLAHHWSQTNVALAPNTGRTINGITAMDFDGTEVMNMINGSGINTVAHIFDVLVIDVNTSGRYIHEAGLVPQDGWWLRQTTTSRMQLQLQNIPSDPDVDLLTTAVANAFTVGTPFRLEVRFAGTGTMGVRIANATETTQAAANGGCASPQNPSLFGNSDGTNLSDGAIAFSCAYSSIKTGTDLTDLRSYINTRFGV